VEIQQSILLIVDIQNILYCLYFLVCLNSLIPLGFKKQYMEIECYYQKCIHIEVIPIDTQQSVRFTLLYYILTTVPLWQFYVASNNNTYLDPHLKCHVLMKYGLFFDRFSWNSITYSFTKIHPEELSWWMKTDGQTCEANRCFLQVCEWKCFLLQMTMRVVKTYWWYNLNLLIDTHKVEFWKCFILNK
jgi:hypothetical protein